MRLIYRKNKNSRRLAPSAIFQPVKRKPHGLRGTSRTVFKTHSTSSQRYCPFTQRLSPILAHPSDHSKTVTRSPTVSHSMTPSSAAGTDRTFNTLTQIQNCEEVGSVGDSVVVLSTIAVLISSVCDAAFDAADTFAKIKPILRNMLIAQYRIVDILKLMVRLLIALRDEVMSGLPEK